MKMRPKNIPFFTELINVNDVYLNFLFELFFDKCLQICFVLSPFHLIKAEKYLIRRSRRFYHNKVHIVEKKLRNLLLRMVMY